LKSCKKHALGLCQKVPEKCLLDLESLEAFQDLIADFLCPVVFSLRICEMSQQSPFPPGWTQPETPEPPLPKTVPPEMWRQFARVSATAMGFLWGGAALIGGGFAFYYYRTLLSFVLLQSHCSVDKHKNADSREKDINEK